MDFGDLLFLLIIFAPLLSRLLGRLRRQQPTPRRPEHPDEVERPLEAPTMARPEEDPLAEALRQIREALGEAPEPLREKPRPPRERPVPAEAPVPRSRTGREFRPTGAFEHDEHGFGRSNPLSEETFERTPRLPGRPRPATLRPPPQPPKPAEVPPPGRKPAFDMGADIRAMLRDEDRVREAFVLKEILDRPHRIRTRRR